MMSCRIVLLTGIGMAATTCASLTLHAQTTVEATSPVQQITTAQPVPLIVTITAPQQKNLLSPGDSLGPWLVLSRLPGSTQRQNGNTVTTENLLITCLDSGTIALPPLQISGTDSVFATGLRWEVTPPPPDSLKDYRPIKEWEALQESGWEWWWFVVPAVLVILAVWYFLRKKNKPETVAAPLTPRFIESEWQRLAKAWQSGEINSETLGNRWMEIFRNQSGIPSGKKQALAAFEIITHFKGKTSRASLDELVLYLTICQAAQFGQLSLDGTTGTELINFGKNWRQANAEELATS